MSWIARPSRASPGRSTAKPTAASARERTVRRLAAGGAAGVVLGGRVAAVVVASASERNEANSQSERDPESKSGNSLKHLLAPRWSGKFVGDNSHIVGVCQRLISSGRNFIGGRFRPPHGGP